MARFLKAILDIALTPESEGIEEKRKAISANLNLFLDDSVKKIIGLRDFPDLADEALECGALEKERAHIKSGAKDIFLDTLSRAQDEVELIWKLSEENRKLA